MTLDLEAIKERAGNGYVMQREDGPTINASAAFEDVPALVEEVERLREALERIAEKGGWETRWAVDEAEPDLGKQPSLVNIAGDIAREALSPQPEGAQRRG